MDHKLLFVFGFHEIVSVNYKGYFIWKFSSNVTGFIKSYEALWDSNPRTVKPRVLIQIT